MTLAALAYLSFVALAVIGPGWAIQRLARVTPDPLLVLPLGTALAAAFYWASLVLGTPWLFPLAVATLGVSAFVVGRSPGRRLDGEGLSALVAPGLALAAFLGVTQYPWNRVAGDGDFLLDPMGDHPLHVGLAWELVLPWPPQVPGLSGIGLAYHYGADLVRAAALRWAGTHPYDSVSRFEVTLFALALAGTLCAAARMAGGSRLAVALVPWTLLATDFSFALAAPLGAHFWADVFRGNLLVSLAFDNPVVPALGLALGCLVALHRHHAGEGRGWLALAAVQAAVLPFFKVFVAAQLLLGLAAACALGRPRRSTSLVLLAALPGTLALVLGPAAGRVELAWAPLDMAAGSLVNLHIEPPGGVRLLAWSAVWLVVSLGLRLLGLPAALRSLASARPAAVALAAMALSGWPLGLAFSASARDLDGHPLPSATNFFVEQSGATLWIFTAVALARLAERRRRAPLLLGAALLALPSTLEFVASKRREGVRRIPASFVRVMHALERESRPGDVVLQRPGGRYPPLPVVLVGRRVPYERFTPYLTQFAPPEELRRRHEALFRFFHTRDAGEAAALARSFGARFVCLYGPDRLRFPAEALLEPVAREADASCYRLRSAGVQPAERRP